MLSRLARASRPGVLNVARAPIRPRYVALMRANSTVTSSPKGDDKEVAALKPLPPSFAEKYHLNDWRIAVPLGLFVGIPAVRNEIYVLNEESQLAVCFMLFVGAGYKFLHTHVAAYFEGQRAEMLRAVNEAEDSHIDRIEEAINQYKSIGAFEQDVLAITEDMKAFADDCAAVVNNKSKHLLKAEFVDMLEEVVQSEATIARAREAAMVREGVERTKETFYADEGEGEGAALGDDYFKQALSVLEDPESEMEDPVAEVFTKHCVQYLEEMDAEFAKDITLTPGMRKYLQDRSDANLKKYNYTGQRVIIPEVINVNRVPWELFKE